jgi:hypothetical protein
MTITIDTPDFHIADVMRFYRGAESNMFYQESGNHQEPGKSRPGKFVAHVGTNGLTMYRTRMVVCWCRIARSCPGCGRRRALVAASVVRGAISFS